MKHKKVLIIHGPNMNWLGKREKNIYGEKTIKKLNDELGIIANKKKYRAIFYQSNIEGELVSKIQKMANKIDGLLINPAAYTHTSIALRDALMTLDIPKVEVHISNIYKREPFRQYSLISDIVEGQVIGFGTKSYHFGLHALLNSIEAKQDHGKN